MKKAEKTVSTVIITVFKNLRENIRQIKINLIYAKTNFKISKHKVKVYLKI